MEPSEYVGANDTHTKKTFAGAGEFFLHLWLEDDVSDGSWLSAPVRICRLHGHRDLLVVLPSLCGRGSSAERSVLTLPFRAAILRRV